MLKYGINAQSLVMKRLYLTSRSVLFNATHRVKNVYTEVKYMKSDIREKLKSGFLEKVTRKSSRAAKWNYLQPSDRHTEEEILENIEGSRRDYFV